MEHLSIRLLGPIDISLDGQRVVGFKSDKVRALLVYLAVEAGRPHRRESLAGLLWPDYTDRSAFSNLRDTLSNLRTVIHDHQSAPPLLLIAGDTIQFNTSRTFSLDTRDFETLLAKPVKPAEAERWQLAVDAYRGQFLEGFSLRDTAPFEEWAIATRDRLNRLMSSALDRLADYHEERGAYEQAAGYARRQLQIDPLQEDSHRQLMRLLALGGQRSAALAEYEACRRLLQKELGVEPESKTTALYESIRNGEIETAEVLVQEHGPRATARPSQRPLVDTYPPFVLSSPIVARESELARLDNFLDRSLAGQGQVVFVTGEAGAGKTALVGEFVRRAAQAHSDVVVAEGRCNAYTGTGDPYLPFREILQMLTGDIEAKRAAGNVSLDRARRLWAAFPTVMAALVDVAPDCVSLMAPGDALATRARAFAREEFPWQARLEELARRQPGDPSVANQRQPDVIGQFASFLQTLARQFPLILVLDDLQWADAGSISLLFHLGRRLAGSSILLVGAYRPADVALGRGGDRHPLEPIIHELQRDLGDIVVDLDRADGRGFVDALLDSDPNRLSADFRETLYRHTSGQPLFTVELLKGLQERGDLVRDGTGRWIENRSVDWDHLPARAEALIAERLGRLTPKWRAILAAASVEGEEFTAEIVARVQGEDEAETIRGLSGDLTAQNLVSAASLHRLGSQRLSRYRFGHYLVQRYLYTHLDAVERARLHEAMGKALEDMYGVQATTEAALQLAWHFESAGLPAKAIPYLTAAGVAAVRLSALREAIAHFTHGLDLLGTLPDTPERARAELALQLALCAPVQASTISAYPERGRAALRAFALSQQVGTPQQIIQAAYVLWSYFNNRAEYQRAFQSAEHILSLAGSENDPLPVALGHAALGHTGQLLGDLNGAYVHLEQVLVHSGERDYQELVVITGWNLEVACMARCGLVLQALGYPDQALRCSEMALALAEHLGHPYSRAEALASAAVLHGLRRETEQTQAHFVGLRLLADNNGFPLYQACAAFVKGWQQVENGQVQDAIADLKVGEARFEAVGYETYRPLLFALCGWAYGQNGQVGQGLDELHKALLFADRTGAAFFEAEAWRLRGELLVQAEAKTAPGLANNAERAEGREDLDAEGCFMKAITVARGQHARMWEIRATVSLARSWQKQGRTAEAGAMLASIYGWFTEGFGTPDLREAKQLLDDLARMPA